MFSVMKLVLVIIPATTLAPIPQIHRSPRTNSSVAHKSCTMPSCPETRRLGKNISPTTASSPTRRGGPSIKPSSSLTSPRCPLVIPGRLKLAMSKAGFLGETAILSYDANETETIFGQNLTARYHVTDTWLRRNGEWKIVASQAHRYYEDPAIGKIDPEKFGDFIGTYELAPGQTRSITSEGENLFVERKGKKEQLFPETSDLARLRALAAQDSDKT